MMYEWAYSDNYSDHSKTHASDDNGCALCNKKIKLHSFAGRYSGDDFPFNACKKCKKLFIDAAKMDCIEIRKEQICLGELRTPTPEAHR